MLKSVFAMLLGRYMTRAILAMVAKFPRLRSLVFTNINEVYGALKLIVITTLLLALNPKAVYH